MVIPIVALGSNPSKNTGGPSRIGYEILRYFITKGNAVTFLDFSNAKVYNLASVNDLEDISHTHNSLRSLSLLHRIKSSLAQVSPRTVDIARIARHRVIGQRVSYYLRDLDHKLVHIHGVGPTLAFAAFGSARIVWSEHSKGSMLRELEMLYGKPPTGLFSTAIRTAYRRLLSESAAITFPSWSALQLFEEYTGWSVPRDKLTIVYNGIPDPTQLYDLENTEPEEGLVVTVAQHVPEKGLDLALQALAKSNKRWRWLVIGETTPWTNKLRNQIEKVGSQVSVEFLGQQSHKQTLRLMQRAHVILATQRVAVFDLAILEAMALSKPVIATRIGGNVEALGGDYPLMGDSIDDIVGLLELVYKSPAGVQEVGRRNRERFLARFTLEAMINSYVEVYQKVSRA